VSLLRLASYLLLHVHQAATEWEESDVMERSFDRACWLRLAAAIVASRFMQNQKPIRGINPMNCLLADFPLNCSDFIINFMKTSERKKYAERDEI